MAKKRKIIVAHADGRASMMSWGEMFPEGRHIFYEGDDPEGFVTEIKARFKFDPSLDPCWGKAMPDMSGEPDFVSYSFHCPSDILDLVYTEYPMGS